MNPDLLRQRRNLIAVSMVLLIFDFANVKIGKVSVLGTELLVGNAQVLMLCAWLLWAYFLLRYYQYWRAEKANPIRDSYKAAIANCSADFQRGSRFSALHPTRAHAFLLRARSPWAYELFREAYIPELGGRGEVDVYPIGRLRLATWKVRAAWHVLLHTPHATDHVLPFSLAAAAAVAAAHTAVTHLPG